MAPASLYLPPPSFGERDRAAPSLAIEQPCKPLGQEHKKDDDEDAVDEGFKIAEPYQGLRQDNYDGGSEDRAKTGAEPADDSDRQYGHQDMKLTHARIDSQADDRERDPGDAREHRRKHKDAQFVARDVDAQSGRGGFVVANGLQ